MHHLHERFESWLFDPVRTGGQPLLARLVCVARYQYALTRDLWAGDLNLRAMSLVYTTLLSVVPLIAFALSVLKGLGLHHDLAPVLAEFLRPLGAHAGELTVRIVEVVDRLQGRLVGTLGFAVLIYNLMGAIQKIEESFNFIWNVPRLRGAGRRFGEYLGVLIVAPIALVATFGVASGLANHSSLGWLRAHTPLGSVFTAVHGLMPWLLTSLALAFLYSFIPNTRVRGRVALTAGLCTGVVWVAAGFAFSNLGAYSSRMMAVYASFAIALLTLTWLWLSWLILLLGAQLSFYLQNPRHLRTGRRNLVASPRLAERLALSVMTATGEAFAHGRSHPTLDELADRFAIASGVLAPIVLGLEQAGLLVRSADETLLPGRALDGITLASIIDAVREGRQDGSACQKDADTLPAADRIAADIEAAVRDALGARTLAELLEAAPARD